VKRTPLGHFVMHAGPVFQRTVFRAGGFEDVVQTENRSCALVTPGWSPAEIAAMALFPAATAPSALIVIAFHISTLHHPDLAWPSIGLFQKRRGLLRDFL